MKKNEKMELKNKSFDDLKKMINDLRLEITKIKIDIKMAKGTNTAAVREKKKTIARIQTILGMEKYKDASKTETISLKEDSKSKKDKGVKS